MPWARLSTRELLKLMFRDLDLKIPGTSLEEPIDRLYSELDRAGLKFRPHCWLAEEWFSPDGVPGIAIPFYLSHPRLRSLERQQIGEVEGGTADSLMRILRHEAGHALDTAFGLRRRPGWQIIFGRAARPYPESYRPRSGSRRFVHHLDSWYAQIHPTEDFAETFAVWLRPGKAWRRDYRGWPALKKLEYVDALMNDLRSLKPRVRRRQFIEPLRNSSRTLENYYLEKQARYLAARAKGHHPL